MTRLFRLGALGIMVTLGLTVPWREKLWGEENPPKAKSNTLKAPDMTITWAGFDGIKNNNPKEAVYIVNGQRVGKGEEGFSHVLAKLRGLPMGATVYVYPDNRLRSMHFWTNGVGPTSVEVPDNVPFRANRPKSDRDIVYADPAEAPVSPEHAKYRAVKKERQLDVLHFEDTPKGSHDMYDYEEHLPVKVYYMTTEKH